MKNIILRMCLESFGILIACSIFVAYTIQKKPLLKDLTKTEDAITKMIVAVILGYLVLELVVPFIRDIPYVIEKNCLTIEGTATVKDGAGANPKRDVAIEDKRTKEIVRVVFTYSGDIETGDELIVQYVPYSHYGILIEHNGKQIHNYIE